MISLGRYAVTLYIVYHLSGGQQQTLRYELADQPPLPTVSYTLGPKAVQEPVSQPGHVFPMEVAEGWEDNLILSQVSWFPIWLKVTLIKESMELEAGLVSEA